MRKGRIGLGAGTELLLEIVEAAAEAVMADMAVTGKEEGAAKVAMAGIAKADGVEKGGEAAKADLVVTGKGEEAEKAEVAGAAKAVMAGIVREEEAERVDLAEIGKAAVMVDMEASPEGEEASTGTAQKVIPVMTGGGQGKNHEASLGQDLTAPNS
jgi:hypothetical protein